MMKIKITTLILMFISSLSYGQWVDPGNDNTGEIHYNNGRVGIGTSTPTTDLDIKGNIRVGSESEHVLQFTNGTSWMEISTSQRSINMPPKNILFRSYGTSHNSKILFLNGQSGNVGIGTVSPTEKLHAEETIHGENISFRLRAHTASGAGRSWHMTGDPDARKLHVGEEAESSDLVIDQNGNIGMGTTTPTHRLEVNGAIRAQEIKVEASPWPDYVFSDEYELSTLEETASFIKENHHLPGIPSAAEIEENGVNLGKMNALLLKKIEELTLHMIEMKKEIQALKANKL